MSHSTGKVIWRQDLGLKFHLIDWRMPRSSLRTWFYKMSGLTTMSQRLLKDVLLSLMQQYKTLTSRACILPELHDTHDILISVHLSHWIVQFNDLHLLSQPINMVAVILQEIGISQCIFHFGDELMENHSVFIDLKYLPSVRNSTKTCPYEPRREKTGLRGFQPGLTQTGLYKLRKELEA